MAFSSKSVLPPEDLRCLRYYHFVMKYGKKVFHFIYTSFFLQGQHKSIRQILIDNQVPLGRESPFSVNEIKSLTNELPENLNITVMNKICQVLWLKGVNDPGEELRGLMKKIKDERNSVSHEAHNMTHTDLERRLAKFQAVLQETLEKTKFIFPKHSAWIDDLKAEIQDAVSKPLEKIREKYDPSNPQDIQRLKDEIEGFQLELSDMIQKSSEAELQWRNERFCLILPYDWLPQYGTTDPSNIMVCLPVAYDQGLNGGPYDNKSVTVYQNEILNKDKMGKEFDVVIISGDAGSGKTTILRSYVEGWCKKRTDMPELSSFSFLISMEFRNHDHDNFDDYLRSLIPRTVALFPFNLVKSVVLCSKCLVLCDGYDEVNEKSRKLFEDVLALHSNNMTFVVTTRPGDIEELTNIVNKGKRSRINLTVSGLQEVDMKLLTKKLISHMVNDDVTQVEQMKKELLQKIEEMDTGTRAILQTPLYFNLFILHYIERPDLRDEMSPRTSVYLLLRKHKIMRISDKTGISDESLEEFDALYRKWSLKHYTEEKSEWSEADVRRFKKKICSPELHRNFDAIMSSYFSIKKKRESLKTVKVYCHRHKSEQEFAAAGNICDDIITSIRRSKGGKIIREVLKLKGLWDGSDPHQLFWELREVISFIPGILYSTERDVLYETINELHELTASDRLSNVHDDLLEPCIETRLDGRVLESLVSQMERKTSLKEGVRFTQTKSLYVLPSLLCQLRPKKILLRFSSNELRDLSQLDETLRAANESDIHTEVWLRRDLRDCAELSKQDLRPVDELTLVIDVDGYQDLDSLCPISLMTSAKELRLIYHMRNATENRVAQVINRTIRTKREEATIDLRIYLYKDQDVKLLLQSLSVRPLRSITILEPSGAKIGDAEELKTLCRDKGLGKLNSNLWTD
ncbi:uncharacterized protein [Macrobrachium rosenbergii]|uniref:uncharacterized protein n=1 Tax=Macrobrachium rosenbergii TaxID=79674 RepID=UPI0034D6D424